MADYTGKTGNDSFTGTDADDNFYLDQGGNDTGVGGAGDDSFYLGSTFTARDSIDGGAGDFDDLYLAGDYSAGLDITARNMTGIEEIILQNGYQYNLTLGRNLMARGDILSFYFFGTGATPGGAKIDGSQALGDLSFRTSTGDDTFLGGAGNDFFSVRSGGNDTFDGGSGYNRISFYNLSVGVKIDLSIVGLQNIGAGNVAISNIHDLSGTLYADRLTGDASDNWIIANGGNDKIYGAAGDDFIQIGHSTSGNPTDCFVQGGSGTDIVDFNANTFADAAATVDLSMTSAQDTGQGVYTLLNIEDVTGTIFDDKFTGNDQANALFGSDGADTLLGGAGNDRLYGDAVKYHDASHGISGPVIIDMNDTAVFADTLDGGAGNDQLYGGGGDDTLTGGLGSDRIYGGAGNDLIVYTSLDESTARKFDTIFGFEFGDRIDLSAIDADSVQPGDQAFHLVTGDGDPKHPSAGDIFVTYEANTTVLSLYVNGDAKVDAVIKLDGIISVFDANFVF